MIMKIIHDGNKNKQMTVIIIVHPALMFGREAALLLSSNAAMLCTITYNFTKTKALKQKTLNINQHAKS
jgi:hypothetical protein